MKLLAIGTLAMAVGLLAQNPASSAGSQKLYVLHDAAKDVWCGYADASRWRKDIDSVMALEVANIEYINKHPRRISLTIEGPPEVGDWMIDDTYTLNEIGEVLSLKRETRVLPGDARRIETFDRVHGKIVRTSVSTYSLTSGYPISSKQITSPTYSVFSSVSELPFGKLLLSQQNVSQQICAQPVAAQELNEKSLKDLLVKQGFTGQLEGKVQFESLGSLGCNARKLQLFYYQWEQANPSGLAIHASQRIILVGNDKKYVGSYVVDNRPIKIDSETLRFDYPSKLGNSIQCSRNGLPKFVLLNGEIHILEK